jgi:hypothetical protein
MNPLHKKLAIKENQKILLLNAGKEIDELITPLPQGTSVSNRLLGKFDVIQVFASKRNEIEKISNKLVDSLNDSGSLWIAYPKKSSGIDTDLSRDKCWNLFSENEYSPVSLISINDKWASMRFKPNETISKKYAREQTSSEFQKYIDLKNKTVKVPPDLSKMFRNHKAEKEYFKSLAYSHRKEYVQWILEAKREETRAKRINKMIEMLEQRRKNPNDK